MTAPAPTFTAEQLKRINRYTYDLERDINEKCAEQHDVVGRALAVIAAAARPGAQFVRIYGVRLGGQFGRVTCEIDGHREDVCIGPEITSALTAALRRLPAGTSGVWHRDSPVITLDVTAALALGDRYPFLPVQDRLVVHLEEQTGRDIRRIEIGTEVFDNGYFYSDSIEVDYADGDSDEIFAEDMNDFFSDLQNQFGAPGPRTVVTIERTSAGITIK